VAPILMAYPEATIYHLSERGLVPLPYEQTEHFQITRDFLNHRETYLRHLLQESRIAPNNTERYGPEVDCIGKGVNPFVQVRIARDLQNRQSFAGCCEKDGLGASPTGSIRFQEQGQEITLARVKRF